MLTYSNTNKTVIACFRSLSLSNVLQNKQHHTNSNTKFLFLFFSPFQLNPQHCVPTLDDNGFVLWESRAILGYLANKYGKTDSLYPKDAEKRARVDQKLYFDMGTLYQRFGDYWYPQAFMKQPANPEAYKKMEEAMAHFNTALEGQVYACGDNLTIADMALAASIATYEVAKFPIADYPNVKRWLEKCKATIPGYDLNQKGAEEFAHYLKDLV